jgi:uroporphyrinogen-III decarboxylase
MSRPFTDAEGARDWLIRRTRQNIEKLRNFDPAAERKKYTKYFMDMQVLIGETVIMDVLEIDTRFCDVYDKMGLEIFSFFYYDYPEVMKDFMDSSGELAVRRARAVADNSMTPVTCVAEDFCTRQGPIFSPELLYEVHYPHVKNLTEAWHEKGLKVIYHTDGNFKKVIPDLLACGVDGFYCLERACGMHIEELSKEWPDVFWAGGVDATNIMERGTVEQTIEEVRRVILGTDVLTRGGIFVDTASEINPPVQPKNFIAMLETVDEIRNPDFYA